MINMKVVSKMIITLLLLGLPLVSQAQHGHHNGGENGFTSEFTEMIQHYFAMKDALVESDADQAVEAASHMQMKLESIGEHRLEGDEHMEWMQTYGKLEAQLADVSESGELEEIRTHFYALSETLIEGVKVFGVEGVVYHQYCPMAFNNEGGGWLSSEDQVMNPYMPDTMLRCGEVIERIE